MISVCLATYNGEKYIVEQLQSVLSQLGEHDEVIVSDDGSTDATCEVIRNMADSRIRLVKGPCLKSPTLNFEHAIALAQGEYIFLCDQDDVWMPNKVEVMMKALQDYACVVSDCEVTDSQLNTTAPSFRQQIGAKNGRFYNLFVKNSYSGSCMAFRKEVAQMAGPTPNGVFMHDIWLGNVAAFHFSLTFIEDKLIKFRRHTDSASTAAGKSNNPFFLRLYSRLKTAFCLLFLRLNK